MKKLATLLVAIALIACVVFTGCSDNKEQQTSSSASSAVSTDSAAASTDSAASSASASAVQSAQNTDSTPSASAEPVSDSFFDDAVFVGDSVTLKLSYYADKQRSSGSSCLGNATFLCSGSLGYGNSLWDLNKEGNVHPSYQGTKYLIQNGVAAIHAKKVFIMLGINDVALYGVDATVENATTLIDKIIAESPDATIYLQSATPIIASCEVGAFKNENLRALNAKLKTLAEEKNWKYLDVYSAMADENGCLKAEYCSDPDNLGIHFTDEACKVWIDYLKNNVNK